MAGEEICVLNMLMRWAGFVFVVVLGAACPRAHAEDFGNLEIHSFLSQGYIYTTNNNYLANSSTGSFDFTEIGINFTKQLDENLRAGVQLFAQRLGASETFSSQFDWFYLDYHWSDYLGIRVGRVKIPFGLYNDILDIDSARAPILLPQSIYPEANTNYLLAQTGVELYGYSGRGSLGELEYRLYGGTISVPFTNTPGASAQVLTFDVSYDVGGRVMWDTPVEGLRIGGSLQSFLVNTNILYEGPTLPFLSTGQTIVDQAPGVYWVGSVEYNKGDLLLASEYSQWGVISNVSVPQLNTSSIRQGGYVMGAYRVKSWLQPAVYYSVMYPNMGTYSGPQNQQQDISATLRFDLNQFWLVKLEGHYMNGTAGLDTSINNSASLASLPSSWGAFLIKTTGYF